MRKVRIVIYHPEGIVIYKILRRGKIKKGDWLLNPLSFARTYAADGSIGKLAQHVSDDVLRPVSFDFTGATRTRKPRKPFIYDGEGK